MFPTRVFNPHSSCFPGVNLDKREWVWGLRTIESLQAWDSQVSRSLVSVTFCFSGSCLNFFTDYLTLLHLLVSTSQHVWRTEAILQLSLRNLSVSVCIQLSQRLNGLDHDGFSSSYSTLIPPNRNKVEEWKGEREVALYVLLLLCIHAHQGLNPTAVCTMSLNTSEEKCMVQWFWLIAKEIPVMLLYDLEFLISPPLPPALANTELSSLFIPGESFPATESEEHIISLES